MAGGVKFPSSTMEDSWNTFRTQISSGDDCDDLRDSTAVYGFYSWGGSAPANAPSTYCIMLAMNDSNQGQQLAWGSSGTTSVWARRANSGTWASWNLVG